MRARGRISEPALRDLCFTPAEATQFLAAAGCAIEEQLVGKLDVQVEGWPVGWRLLLQALRRAGGQAAVFAELDSRLPDIQAYLLKEVLERQTPSTRDYLLKTAVLDRFCAELVDAVCQPVGAAADDLDGRVFMESLQREGLFGIALDPSNRWLRYHHVFQELLQAELRRQLAPADIHALHMRASLWLEQHGLIERRDTTCARGGEPGRGGEDRRAPLARGARQRAVVGARKLARADTGCRKAGAARNIARVGLGRPFPRSFRFAAAVRRGDRFGGRRRGRSVRRSSPTYTYLKESLAYWSGRRRARACVISKPCAGCRRGASSCASASRRFISRWLGIAAATRAAALRGARSAACRRSAQGAVLRATACGQSVHARTVGRCAARGSAGPADRGSRSARATQLHEGLG